MINLSKQAATQLIGSYGPAFYLADTNQLTANYHRFFETFNSLYPNFALAYSYKTNYLPHFCRQLHELGSYAEVVSTMELELARQIGVPYERIIWNGPYKPAPELHDFLTKGGTVNLDSIEEAQQVLAWATAAPACHFKVGIRCNFAIGDKNISRFGFAVESDDFSSLIKELSTNQAIDFIGLHCHFSPRNANTWQARVSGMLDILRTYHLTPKRLDFGGSLFGEMAPETAAQYKATIPSWNDYAKAITSQLKRYFGENGPLPQLLLEPGSALVGNCLTFAAQVINIRFIRGKSIATAVGSSYNLTQSLSRKNPPLSIVPLGSNRHCYDDLDIGGFTCIDFDYLYRHYTGELAPGDLLLFQDMGAYSLVLRPPFILPNFPVLEITPNGVQEHKRGENFHDVFGSYQLE